MQHMPDKEFDKLFKDQFVDAEIEPSVDLWSNIEKELAPRKKRVVPIFWMAAASVAVAITAMLVFQQKEVIKLQGTTDPLAQTVTSEPIDTKSLSVEEVSTVAPVQKMMVAKTTERKVRATVNESNIHTGKGIEEVQEKNPTTLQPIANNERLAIKQQDVKPIDVLPKEVVKVETPVFVAANVEKEMVQDPEGSAAAERKGIRNVGDLVNFVVDKVDKREKKFVRFNTDDDDNSSIVGINIGFLKFNKKGKD